MSTITITFSDIPIGTEDHTGTQTVNSGDMIDLEMTRVKNTVSLMTVSDTANDTTQEIDYQQLATEHGEIIAQGKTSVEIAQWF